MPSLQTNLDHNNTLEWPPGTVLLDDLNSNPTGKKVILQPRPTEDPNDPLNWSRWRKYLNFLIVCIYSVLVCEVTSSSTPTWGPMQKELGFSDAELNDSYAIGCAALGIGAVLLIPFALKFGRRPLYLGSTITQCAVSVWSAKVQNIADLLLTNALRCGVGGLAEVMVQMTIADVFFVHQRGRMNSIYIWLWKTSAPLGSLIVGYITLDQGWRWNGWWNAIFFGGFALIVAFLYEETKYCPPSFLTTQPALSNVSEGIHISNSASVIKPYSENVEVALRQCVTEPSPDLYAVRIDHDIPKKTYREKLSLTTTTQTSSDEGFSSLIRHMYQPIILLTTIPAVTYVAFVYGILVALSDLMQTSIATYMKEPPYNFNSAQIGLMSLPKIIGVTVGCVIGGPLSDWLVIYLSRRNRGVYEPETRLWCLCLFLPLVPAGAILNGIGLNNGLSWPLVALGVVLFNIGVAPINSVALTYLTDSYEEIIGDALVGVTIVRNTFSTAFIFALTPWINKIGIINVFVTILLIAVFIVALFGVFLKWGKLFRVRFAARYRHYAARQYRERGREQGYQIA